MLLRNEAAAGNPARWLGVKLVGKGNRDVTGSTVTLATDTRTLSASPREEAVICPRATGAFFRPGYVRTGTPPVGAMGLGAVQHFDNLEPGSYWELPRAKRRRSVANSQPLLLVV